MIGGLTLLDCCEEGCGRAALACRKDLAACALVAGVAAILTVTLLLPQLCAAGGDVTEDRGVDFYQVSRK